MSSAEWLIALMIFLFAGFWAWEGVQKLRGKQTASQWIIANKHRPFVWWFFLLFALSLIGIGAWLIPHWEYI